MDGGGVGHAGDFVLEVVHGRVRGVERGGHVCGCSAVEGRGGGAPWGAEAPRDAGAVGPLGVRDFDVLPLHGDDLLVRVQLHRRLLFGDEGDTAPEALVQALGDGADLPLHPGVGVVPPFAFAKAFAALAALAALASPRLPRGEGRGLDERPLARGGALPAAMLAAIVGDDPPFHYFLLLFVTSQEFRVTALDHKKPVVLQNVPGTAEDDVAEQVLGDGVLAPELAAGHFDSGVSGDCAAFAVRNEQPLVEDEAVDVLHGDHALHPMVVQQNKLVLFNAEDHPRVLRVDADQVVQVVLACPGLARHPNVCAGLHIIHEHRHLLLGDV
mmetsp:Transcript_37648/g.67157  ORF Transcript_37648/g.67157 Transcript_37648/m.67157 type:complete len:327 (-) Transcript_37648:1462-2442(-)